MADVTLPSIEPYLISLKVNIARIERHEEHPTMVKCGLFSAGVLLSFGLIGPYLLSVGAAQKQKPRILYAPPAFYKTETFVEMNDADRQVYTAGLIDGFFASAFFGASDETVANLNSCIKDMDTKQLSAIITKYAKDHPENWHLPLSVLAHSALDKACPGGLRVIDAKQ
jgi:hypothetical protein